MTVQIHRFYALRLCNSITFSKNPLLSVHYPVDKDSGFLFSYMACAMLKAHLKTTQLRFNYLKIIFWCVRLMPENRRFSYVVKFQIDRREC